MDAISEHLNPSFNSPVDIVNEVNNLQASLQPVHEILISMGDTYYKTPRYARKYISRTAIERLRKSLKDPYDDINHTLFLLRKAASVPSEAISEIFNNEVNNIKEMIEPLISIANNIKYNIIRKSRPHLRANRVMLETLFTKTYPWYLKTSQSIIDNTPLSLRNQLTKTDLEWVRVETFQGYHNHIINIKKELSQLIPIDTRLHSSFPSIMAIFESKDIIDRLTYMGKDDTHYKMEAIPEPNVYRVSQSMKVIINYNKLSTLIKHKDKLITILLTSDITVQNIKDIDNNNSDFKINTLFRMDQNILNTEYIIGSMDERDINADQ